MIPLLWRCPASLRPLALAAILLLGFQWFFVPSFTEAFTEKWLWALDPARSFPEWFRLGFPLFLLFFPFHVLGSDERRQRLRMGSARWVLPAGAGVVSGFLFWFLRIGKLELGDAKLIMDHFMSLTTYASVREPLESILHTEVARFLFFNWGLHPMTSFQIQSCFLGAMTVGTVAWAFRRLPVSWSVKPAWAFFLFLVGPIHLFFGYVEWYTQLATGIILFQVFALRYLLLGRNLWPALMSFLFAACSHLVGFIFFPASLYLVSCTHRGKQRSKTLLLFLAALLLGLGGTILLIKQRIRFQASVQATTALFPTLLPFMREENPNNPPGSWTYAWLSGNHLGDLGNLLLLCGLFPLLVVFGAWLLREKPVRFSGKDVEMDPSSPQPGTPGKVLLIFFGLELLPCVAFLFLWNPWLGFPSDWDLFSFFAWPLLAAAVVVLGTVHHCRFRSHLILASAVPAFSVVSAWVLYYHHGSLSPIRDLFLKKDEGYYDRLLNEAEFATQIGDWSEAFEKVEKVMRNRPDRKARCFHVFRPSVIQQMSMEWPPEEKLTPLAVDFEIISASPMQRLLVLDLWGRVFFWEGGYFNDWSPGGIPGTPEHRAVDMEIVPWKKAAVILRDDGRMFEVPISSWLEMNPEYPRQTRFVTPPVDRTPKDIGNLYEDYAKISLGRGQKAVCFTVDYWHKRLVALDTTGNLVADSGGEIFDVTEKAALVRNDVESNYNGEILFTCDTFGRVRAWPGGSSPVLVLIEHGWPAVTDIELGRGGNDVYVLDGQGGVFAFSRLGSAPIDPAAMRHYAPTGELLDKTPYNTAPFVFFIDLETIPQVPAYFRMTKNFRIHYSEAVEPH